MNPSRSVRTNCQSGYGSALTLSHSQRVARCSYSCRAPTTFRGYSNHRRPHRWRQNGGYRRRRRGCSQQQYHYMPCGAHFHRRCFGRSSLWWGGGSRWWCHSANFGRRSYRRRSTRNHRAQNTRRGRPFCFSTPRALTRQTLTRRSKHERGKRGAIRANSWRYWTRGYSSNCHDSHYWRWALAGSGRRRSCGPSSGRSSHGYSSPILSSCHAQLSCNSAHWCTRRTRSLTAPPVGWSRTATGAGAVATPLPTSVGPTKGGAAASRARLAPFRAA